MNVLVLAPRGSDAELSDVDFVKAFQYGDGKVLHLDPEPTYCRYGMAGLEGEVLRMVQENAVKILVYALGAEFDFFPSFFSDRLGALYKVLVLGDDGQYFEVSHRYYAQCFDLVLTVNPPLRDQYGLYGTDAWVIPSVFDSAVFHPASDKRKDYDVSFVGGMVGKEGRDSYAKALKEAGIDVRVFGAGTAAGVVSAQQVIEIFRRSRINLNFTRGNLTPLDRHIKINRRLRQVKARAPKVALCGSFVLSEYAAGLEQLFKIGSEIDVFQNEEDLVQKVRHYLEHEDRREAMAAKAHARALEQYDAAKFWTRLTREIESRANSEQRSPRLPICFDPTFWSNFGSWRFKYLVVFFFTARPMLFLRELALLVRIARFKVYVAAWAAALGLNAASNFSPIAGALNQVSRRVRKAL